GDQRRLAADAVAVMAEDRRTDRPPDEADEICREGQERGGGRIRVREIELAEDQSGGGTVEEEVVPLDGGADRGGDDRLAQFSAVVGRGKRAGSGCGGHCAFPPWLCSRPVRTGAYS